MKKRTVTLSPRRSIGLESRDAGSLFSGGSIAGMNVQSWNARGASSQGHQEEALVAAVTQAVAADISNPQYFQMRARRLGTETDFTSDDPFCYAFNVAPNVTMNHVAFKQHISMALDYAGECYLIELQGPNGSITLSPFVGGMVHVLYAEHGQHNSDGSPAVIAGYIMRDNMGRELGRFDYQGFAISGIAEGRLHRIYYPFPNNPYKANSFIQAAGLPIDVVHYSRLATRSLLMNTAQPAGLIQIMDPTVSEESIYDFDQRINSRLSDITQKGRTLVVGSDVAYTKIGDTNPGTGWSDISQRARDEVLSIWSMPESRLARGGAKTYENQRTELATYFKNMVLTRLNLIAATLSQSTREKGYELYFEASDLPELSLDAEVKLDKAQRIWDSGFCTMDEARQMVGLPNIGGSMGSQFVSQPDLKQPPENMGQAGRDAAPFVRAAEPHPLAVTLDDLIESQIQTFGKFAQGYHERAFSRITGGLKRRAGVRATDPADALVPDNIDAGDLFDEQGWDGELHNDTKGNLQAIAAAALAALALHFHDPAIAALPVASVINNRLGVLMDGTAERLSWNAAIGRDLQKILVQARLRGISVQEAIAQIGDMLGVDVTSAGTAAADQGIGSRALAITVRSVHGVINDMAMGAYADQGVQLKSWQSMGDERVRPSHEEADATYGMDPIPVNQPFMVGGFPMDSPGDSSAPASETDGCRCVVVPA